MAYEPKIVRHDGGQSVPMKLIEETEYQQMKNKIRALLCESQEKDQRNKAFLEWLEEYEKTVKKDNAQIGLATIRTVLTVAKEML